MKTEMLNFSPNWTDVNKRQVLSSIINSNMVLHLIITNSSIKQKNGHSRITSW